jgi:hypothetical protein
MELMLKGQINWPHTHVSICVCVCVCVCVEDENGCDLHWHDVKKIINSKLGPATTDVKSNIWVDKKQPQNPMDSRSMHFLLVGESSGIGIFLQSSPFTSYNSAVLHCL